MNAPSAAQAQAPLPLIEDLLTDWLRDRFAQVFPACPEAAAAGQSIYEYNKETGRHYGRLVERVTRYV